MKIPNKEECLELLRANKTPENIIDHCIAVHDFALMIATKLEKNGIAVNKSLVAAAAMLHDIEKLQPNHVRAGSLLIANKGYLDVARVMKKHGLEDFKDSSYHPITLEEKIVFYADKRLQDTLVVSLKQRFAYIQNKYSYGGIEQEIQFAKNIQQELWQLAGEQF